MAFIRASICLSFLANSLESLSISLVFASLLYFSTFNLDSLSSYLASKVLSFSSNSLLVIVNYPIYFSYASFMAATALAFALSDALTFATESRFLLIWLNLRYNFSCSMLSLSYMTAILFSLPSVS